MTEVDYPVMPEPEWAKPRDKKMQSTVWPVSFSLEFVPFMFGDEKTLPCSFEGVTFFSELKSKTEMWQNLCTFTTNRAVYRKFENGGFPVK